jgi:uncharacterized protein (TIGR02246 family)
MTNRPTLSTSTVDPDAVTADLVDVLQRGLDEFDADLYDSRFAADLLWGSPYGKVLAGYDALNTVHHSLMDRGTGADSVYEVVRTLAPADDVVIAHVRRRALDGPAGFSEMAMYVLVRRDNAWWLAGGQNTLIAE